uniref:Uncharacterized protein n=1 Tax=Anguilla anguilla TaxID=7936 RepID=A0A0E9V1H4_ANGAN
MIDTKEGRRTKLPILLLT